ncbi:LVIVD repeat-containing protein [Rhizomonospora bruguierae]|uniref:LVIVD repeat-containing protein n=1 Tax=Rhizomonospora bruguierae TaxID=1581705 RepID=UPI001BCCCAF8|nr:hypothetical protein [Micromonospora sp. NBRC 107566]
MPFSHGVTEVGYHDLDGRSGFKLAMQEVDNRFFLYVAALWEPGLSILDVTEPERPRLLRWIPGPSATWTIQVQVADGRMITGLEHIPTGWSAGDRSTPQNGFVVWDVSTPDDPVELGRWDSGGTGTHRNFYAGGDLVHTAANMDGFEGHIYAAVDISDPGRPTLKGRWWWPGQHAAAGESYPDADRDRLRKGKPFPDVAATKQHNLSLHGGAYREGDRVYAPWMRAGLVILDVSDEANPTLVSNLSFYPPLGSSIALHTAMPLPDRGLVLVNSEALNENCNEPVNVAGIVDVSDETDPILISLFPQPRPPRGYPGRGFAAKGGRFGPHNQHQPQGQACLAPVENTVHLTYFNAGLQIYDISDPRDPFVTAYHIPDDPPSRRGPLPRTLVTQVEDVLVDRRGFIYFSEKNTGITILRQD